jgi:tungstate transport system permease protein
MTTTIALETSKGNLELALALGIILLSIAVAINTAIHWISSFGRKYQVKR